jgi:hypothetical protein
MAGRLVPWGRTKDGQKAKESSANFQMIGQKKVKVRVDIKTSSCLYFVIIMDDIQKERHAAGPREGRKGVAGSERDGGSKEMEMSKK